jgi:hypothetical protein
VLVALVYFDLLQMRVLILVVYILTALLFFSTRRAYLKLAGRLGELRALNRIGQAVSANLEFDDLVVAIREELGSCRYLAYLPRLIHPRNLLPGPLRGGITGRRRATHVR